MRIAHIRVFLDVRLKVLFVRVRLLVGFGEVVRILRTLFVVLDVPTVVVVWVVFYNFGSEWRIRILWTVHGVVFGEFKSISLW